MKKHGLFFVAFFLLAFSAGAADSAASKPQMVITNVNSQPVTDVPPASFTGSAKVQQLFGPHDQSKISAGTVTFQPKARSAWHTHPAGQIIMVSEGTGWVQEWGKPAIRIKKGDIIWTPPGVKHWHGASAESSMTHTSIQEVVDGRNVDWLEKVSDKQYEEAGK